MGKNVRKCNENGKVNFMGLCKVGVSVIEASKYRSDSVVESSFGGFLITLQYCCMIVFVLITGSIWL